MKLLKIILIITLTMTANILRATEKDLYDFMWLDPDKKVYVLQNKVHQKEHAVYLNLGYGSGMSSTFMDTSLLSGNLGFYLNEEWAIEGIYTKYSNSENDSFSNIKKVNGVVPFIRRPLSSYAALIKWSPFYGKINTFNKIFYFDWAFGVGAGQLKAESNKDTVANASSANTYSKESYANIIAKTEITFHASKNVHFSLGLNINNYKAPGPTVNNLQSTSKLRSDMDALLSIGFSY